MFSKVLIVFLITYIGILEAKPPPSSRTKNSESVRQSPATEDVHSSSHIITIERLEALLRRASEIFKPHLEVRQTDLPSSESQQIAVPMQYMQPPNQPYNFYLPLFDYDESDDTTKQLDDKSRSNMENFTPPRKPKDDTVTNNFYDVKPKKSPKKFNAGSKHINIKWLNNYEKQLTSPSNKQVVNIPKDVYLMNDERNRINFDDAFFTADMRVPDRTNKLDKPNHSEAEHAPHHDDYLNQGEEDLIAAAAFQIPLIGDFTSSRRI